MKTELSEKLFAKAKQSIPGGVNSPVRAFKSVGGTPPFIVRAKGAYVYDADGNEYLDYVGTWGPAILGHAAPEVLTDLHYAMKNGLSFGAPTPKEIDLAEKVKELVPSIDKVRFVNSGTEATMSAIRLARGYTKRDKIIKFDGCYHGHADYLLVKAGSGAETCGVPDSAGVPKSFTEHTLSARYNDLESVQAVLEANKNEVACVIVEPIIGNMGCIPPQEGFLQGLRKLCDEHKTLLIFDEVMTGFRVALGGAQELYGITPDLTCFGKIIGGGLPVGAYGGRADIMACVAPEGPVYQAGTLSGNPLAMAVGLKTLTMLSEGKGKVYKELERKGALLEEALQAALDRQKVTAQINRVGSMFSVFFADHPVNTADDARKANGETFNQLFHYYLERGVYVAPSAFEAGFISLKHSDEDLLRTTEVFEGFLEQILS
ncbi:MAG: glutamate-1-semialdehyde 2,1-aminomutase [Deltaproteobacteria bacterium]|nr:glutamate-1-semialdehyde 2,1-aminomutase [Deltaproteobacteria bacterium]